VSLLPKDVKKQGQLARNKKRTLGTEGSHGDKSTPTNTSTSDSVLENASKDKTKNDSKEIPKEKMSVKDSSNLKNSKDPKNWNKDSSNVKNARDSIETKDLVKRSSKAGQESVESEEVAGGEHGMACDLRKGEEAIFRQATDGETKVSGSYGVSMHALLAGSVVTLWVAGIVGSIPLALEV